MDEIWIGIDDTDSSRGGCTTYLACMLRERLKDMAIAGIPRLIRLNPAIPYKTRGNAAVSFKLVGDVKTEEIIEICRDYLKKYGMVHDPRTNPGVVVVDEITDEMRDFATMALRDVIDLRWARKTIREWGIPCIMLKNGRGIIGALASIALDVPSPTYELLAYRSPSMFGRKRNLDRKSVFMADDFAYPLVWDTVDRENDEIVLAPSSPDPVLYGLRSCSIHPLVKSSMMIEGEKPERFQLFITNQSTDMHYIHEDEVDELKNYRSYIIEGTVTEPPEVIRGGHVFFHIQSRFGKVRCGAYEPTKQFRGVVRKLVRGDRIRVWGSMKKNTLNLEKLEIIDLQRIFVSKNPTCHICGKSMESAGKGKGYRCRKCRTFAWEKTREEVKRDLEKGLYEVPPVARRHLAKPLVRYRRRDVHPFR